MDNLKRAVLGAVFGLAIIGCGESNSTEPGGGSGGGGGGVPQPTQVQLRDIVVPHLPSPYYHFGYDQTGRVSDVSFASGLTNYHVVYKNGRISELQNHLLTIQDRLIYRYDDQGRVSQISYSNPNGDAFAHVFLTWQGDQLVGLTRERLTNGQFVTNKIVSLNYYPDGNLEQLTERFPEVPGIQSEATTVDRYEGYDDKLNVDGFGLLHDEFFDHLVFLPGVQLQKGNAARVIRSGDGLNFQEDRVFQYDDRGRPVSMTGDFVELNGPTVGRHTPTSSSFSYY